MNLVNKSAKIQHKLFDVKSNEKSIEMRMRK